MRRLIVVAAAGASLLAAPVSALSFVAKLEGAQEVPPVATAATGLGRVNIMGDMMSVSVSFRNLTTPLTVAHIHCCAPAGVNIGVAVDFTPLPGGLSNNFAFDYDLNAGSTYLPSFLTASGGTAAGARARLVNAFETGNAYFNLHTSTFPGGEIRGQIAVVPEPGTWAMLIVGFGLTGFVARRRRPQTALA